MKKLALLTLITFLFGINLLAQDAKPAQPKQFMQITTIESVDAGGMGRSRMIITNADGSQTDTEMNNLFSMAGINFSNIKENEEKVLRTIRQFTADGWKLDQVIPLSVSPNQNSMGIFLTRYVLTREEVKKAM